MSDVEQILFVHNSLDIFRIQPRVGAGGYKSGEWRIDQRIFTARVRVVGIGSTVEVRLDDPTTGEPFGVVPIPPGQQQAAVESAADSSRNFVLRLVDPASKRTAFVGASFADRSVAFDFTVSIADHERRSARERDIARVANAEDKVQAAREVMPEMAGLYEHRDLRLKQGETIHASIGVKGSAGAARPSGGFLSRIRDAEGAGAGAGLAPPPATGLAPPPAPTPVTWGLAPAAPPAQAAPEPTLWGSAPAVSTAAAAAAPTSWGTAPAEPAARSNDGWATFD